MNRCIGMILLTVVWGIPETTAVAGKPIAIAVLNFTNQAQGDTEWNWLEKALPDLLINDLSQHPRLQLVPREQMQLAILRLTHRGGLLPEWQEAIGKQLEVSRTVFGTYRVDDDRITLHVSVLDVSKGRQVGSTAAAGVAGDVLKLEKDLARRLTKILTGSLSEAFSQALPVWTDSVPASKLLYQGVDHFDCGRYEDAWLQFRRALRRDPNYADARYWAARMYYCQLRYEHAHTDLESFVRQYPNHPRAGDAVREFVDSFCQTTTDPHKTIEFYTRALPLCKPVQVNVSGEDHRNLKADSWIRTRLAMAYLYLHRRRDAGRQFWAILQDPALPDVYRVEIEEQFFKAIWSVDDLPEDYDGTVHSLPERNAHYEVTDPQTWDEFVSNELPWFVAPEGSEFESLRFGARVAGVRKLPVWIPICVSGLGKELVPIPKLADSSSGNETVMTIREHRWRLPEGMKSLRIKFGRSLFMESDNGRVLQWRLHFGLKTSSGSAELARVAIRPPISSYMIKVDGSLNVAREGETIHGLSSGLHRLQVIPRGPPALVYPAVTTNVDVGGSNGDDVTVRLIPTEGRWSYATTVATRFPVYSTDVPWLGTRQKHGPYGAVRLSAEPLIGWRPQLLLGKRGILIAYWDAYQDLWYATSDDQGHTWSEARRFPAPVNSAHLEAWPHMILDKSGGYRLAFVSDRNTLRRFWPYACASSDMTGWSRPFKVNEKEAGSVHLLQNNADDYLLTQSSYQGVIVTDGSQWGQWSSPRLVKRSAHSSGGVIRPTLYQLPNGVYQLLAAVSGFDPSRAARPRALQTQLCASRSVDMNGFGPWQVLSGWDATHTLWGTPSCHYQQGILVYSWFLDPGHGSTSATWRHRWFFTGDGRKWLASPIIQTHQGSDPGSAIRVDDNNTLVGLKSWGVRQTTYPLTLYALTADHFNKGLKLKPWTPKHYREPE